MLNVPGLCRFRKDGSVIDRSLSKFCNGRPIRIRWRSCGWFEVFHMQHRDAGWVVAQILDRISASDSNPPAIHLHRDFGRIGQAHQLDVRYYSIRFFEFENVIVIAELHAGSAYLFSECIELIRIPSPVIKCKAPFVCWVCALMSGRRTDDVSYAQLMTKGKNLIQVPMQIIRRMMRAD